MSTQNHDVIYQLVHWKLTGESDDGADHYIDLAARIFIDDVWNGTYKNKIFWAGAVCFLMDAGFVWMTNSMMLSGMMFTIAMAMMGAPLIWSSAKFFLMGRLRHYQNLLETEEGRGALMAKGFSKHELDQWFGSMPLPGEEFAQINARVLACSNDVVRGVWQSWQMKKIQLHRRDGDMMRAALDYADRNKVVIEIDAGEDDLLKVPAADHVHFKRGL